MAGTVDLVLRCLTGMRARGRCCGSTWPCRRQVKRVGFSVHYRGHWVEVALRPAIWWSRPRAFLRRLLG